MLNGKRERDKTGILTIEADKKRENKYLDETHYISNDLFYSRPC